jgi:hypothetical protein
MAINIDRQGTQAQVGRQVRRTLGTRSRFVL